MASSASSTFTSIQSIQRRLASHRIAFALGATNFSLLCFPFMLCFCYLQRFCCCFFFWCFLFYIFLCFVLLFLLAILAKFERSAATAAALCISFCGLQHLLCMPHALGAPLPPPTLSPLNGAAHFATLMPIWCTSLSLCHAATAATAASCCCYSKKRSQALASLVCNSSSSTPFPFPSLLLPHFSRVE